MKRRDWWVTAGGLIGGWLMLTAAVQDGGIPRDLVGGSGTLALVIWAGLGGVKLWKELKGGGGAGPGTDEALHLARRAGDVLGSIEKHLVQQTMLLGQLVQEGRDYHEEGRTFMRDHRRAP